MRSRISPQDCAASRSRLAAAVDGADQQILEHRQLFERLRDLVGAGDAGAAAPVRRLAGEVAAVEADRCRMRREAAGDQVEQRGLAGAVRADDADRLAGRNREDQDRRRP